LANLFQSARARFGMKILVIGSWRRQEAKDFAADAVRLGELLAKGGHSLMTGGGKGVPDIVAGSYRKNGGDDFTAYFPSKGEMERVGEERGLEPDRPVMTGLDYPQRNVLMVKNCDAVIALSGALGTLTEIIHAVNDYGKKVAVIDRGEIAAWVKSIPALKPGVFLTGSPEAALSHVVSGAPATQG